MTPLLLRVAELVGADPDDGPADLPVVDTRPVAPSCRSRGWTTCWRLPPRAAGGPCVLVQLLVDVEWALGAVAGRHEGWCLQARPITTLPQPCQVGDQPVRWAP